MPQEQIVSDDEIDWSQYDDLFKNMFMDNPRFFKGMLSDEAIEEQLIENTIGSFSHEDRMDVFHMMMNPKAPEK